MAQANILIAVQTLNVNNVLNQLNNIGQTGQKAANQVQTSLNSIQQQLRKASGALSSIRTVVTVLGIREAIRSFVELSDGMQNARNRLAIVSRSQEDAAATMFKLKEVALATRSDFDLTTRSYARTAQATKALGLSQSENIAITKTLQQAIAVSGATSEEAHATLIQLTQAMASNRLSADEFRSVAEQLPVVLDMIAKATGKPRTELKKMGEEGKLTAAVLSYSILRAQYEMDEAFAKTMPTISQSWENLSTQVKFTLDRFNETTGASRGVVSALQFLSEHTDQAAKVLQFLAVATIPLVIVKLAELGIALKVLAFSNPFTALAASAGIFLATLAEVYPDYKAAISGPTGRPMSKAEYAAFQEKQKGIEGTDAYIKEQNRKDIQGQIDRKHLEKLRKQMLIDINTTKTKKGRKGPHVTTFEEASASLSQEVAEMSLRPHEREELKAVMDIQDRMNGSLREGEKGYKMLTQPQRERVAELIKERENLRLSAEAEDDVAKAHIERQEELRRRNEEFAKRNFQLREEEQERIQRLARGDFGSFSDPVEASRARALIDSGKVPGNKDSLRNQLEIAGQNTKPARKAWLEEIEGIGKFREDLESIFGPDGTIASGFSRALASSIVFHKSFKDAIHDLGQTIQVEVLDTLIKGLIRMSILGMMGGGSSSGFVDGLIRANPYGSGKAAGGYVSGPRTRIMGYHHGGEFIMNAAATDKNRDMLEAMNSGKDVIAKSGGGGTMNVTVLNYAGVDIQSRQLGPDHVELIARQVAREEAGKATAATLNDPNSPFSRRISQKTNARRQR